MKNTLPAYISNFESRIQSLKDQLNSFDSISDLDRIQFQTRLLELDALLDLIRNGKTPEPNRSKTRRTSVEDGMPNADIGIWLGSCLKVKKDMTQASKLQFAHRKNEDGTIDSICCYCFATVATASSEPDLERKECNHTCDPWLVELYKKV